MGDWHEMIRESTGRYFIVWMGSKKNGRSYTGPEARILGFLGSDGFIRFANQ